MACINQLITRFRLSQIWWPRKLSENAVVAWKNKKQKKETECRNESKTNRRIKLPNIVGVPNSQTTQTRGMHRARRGLTLVGITEYSLLSPCHH